MRAHDVIADLSWGGYDAYIHHERIDPLNPRRRFHQECVRRYFSWRLRVPGIGLRSMPTPRLSALSSPYARREIDCYAGALWFTCNRRTAEYLLDWSGANPWLEDHLRNRPIVEETYFQTVLANQCEFRLCGDYRRYIDWSRGGSHPKILGPEDLSAMIASGAHFGRKFAPGGAILDFLDQHLGVSAAA